VSVRSGANCAPSLSRSWRTYRSIGWSTAATGRIAATSVDAVSPARATCAHTRDSIIIISTTTSSSSHSSSNDKDRPSGSYRHILKIEKIRYLQNHLADFEEI